MRAIFPGSFDPVTIGHLNLIGRSLGFLDELVVAVMYNPDKPGFFPVKQRIELLKEACRERGYARCRVLADEGLLVNLARKEDIRLVVRGVRNSAERG